MNNFPTFLNKFLRRYWNEQAQHELRRRMEFGSHQEGKIGSRAEYAIRLYAEAKELRPIMSSKEIIQKLARHYNEEIKYAIIGRGIDDINDLVELLENFDRIGPINMNDGREREKKMHDGIRNEFSRNQPTISPSWRTQTRGDFQDKGRHTPQHSNISSWPRNAHGNYGNHREKNVERNTGRDTYRNNQPMDNRPWRENPRTTHQIRNIEVEPESLQENIQEKNNPDMESGNEYQPRL